MLFVYRVVTATFSETQTGSKIRKVEIFTNYKRCFSKMCTALTSTSTFILIYNQFIKSYSSFVSVVFTIPTVIQIRQFMIQHLKR